MSADASLLRQSKSPVTLDVHGTRVLYWPCPEAQQPSATLIFIVGNPGLADYYVQYLGELQRLVHSDGRASIEVFCVSQLGHDPHALSSPSKMISLEEQVQNKADIISTISGRWTSARRPTLLLAGHSIGAYMALEVVRRKLCVSTVASVHLLFPTLHQIGLTPNARKLAWLLKANDKPVVERFFPSALMLLTMLVSVVLRLVQCLPLPLVHFIVLCAAPSQPVSALKVTSDFILDPASVQQALFLARDEMRLVKRVQNLLDISSSPTKGSLGASKELSGKPARNGHQASPVKLRAYWASGDLDGWVPASTRAAVEEALELQSFELPADISDKNKSATVQKQLRKKRSYTVDEIRKARQGGKRRALAGMVHAGASAGYGIASSLGNIGYRRRTGQVAGPPPSASSGMRKLDSPLSSPQRTLRRRPSLVAARASRRFDGSIVIEPAADTDEEDLDLLAKDPDDVAEGVVFTPEGLVQSPLGAAWEAGENGGGLAGNQAAGAPMKMPDRASIVCKLGMPHAFVLEHSEKMAAISSAMVIADILS